MAHFVSDTVTPACEEVLDAVVAANFGASPSYGDDDWTRVLQQRMSEVFEKEVAVFPTVSGTISNALALSALTASYGNVYCHEMAHINVDECGAPEFFTGGAKIVPIPGQSAKITHRSLRSSVYGRDIVHHTQPSVVSVTQSNEFGMVYSVEEIREICDAAHDLGMSVHMDGARFANGLVSLNVTPAEMTWKAGIDVLSFGGTKNGCMMAEAVVFFDAARVGAFPYLHKRAGQLIPKMRFISSQLVAYLTDDLWLSNARNANAMAKRLSDGLDSIPGTEIVYPTQSNEVFVQLPDGVKARLRDSGYIVNDNEYDGTVPPRFVTAWNTSESEVDDFISAATP